MKTMSRLSSSGFLHLALFLVASLFATSTFACTTDQWKVNGSVTADGAVSANDPDSNVPRVNGLCGLQVTDAGEVRDGSPSVDTNFIGRFYFLPEFTGTGTVDIFKAYSDEAGTVEVFTVRYDGTNIIFDASASNVPGGVAIEVATVPADTTHWNLVEFVWTSGAEGKLWVNSDATTDVADGVFPSGTGSVESVTLGAINITGTLTGKANFDEYVSHRTTQVGGVPFIGDGNGDDAVDVSDIVITRNEALGRALLPGKPDCTLDGAVDVADIVFVRNLALGR